MPKKYPRLKRQEILEILHVYGFKCTGCVGSHEKYEAVIKGKRRVVTVITSKNDFDYLLKFIIEQSGLNREEFYGATKGTKKKI
jgi:predicted RNA binding protein YcfA (HicA-like mRNA interferase family)